MKRVTQAAALVALTFAPVWAASAQDAGAALDRLEARLRLVDAEIAQLRGEVERLRGELADLRTAAPPRMSEEDMKQRLGGIMTELLALVAKFQEDPTLRDDPAVKERAQALENEGKTLIDALTGGDRALEQELQQEIMAKYVDREKAMPGLRAAKASTEQVICASNLSQIYKGMALYVSVLGGNSAYPPHTGAAFLRCLGGQCGGADAHPADYAEKAPLAGSADLFRCPTAAGAEGTLDYLGPQRCEGLADDAPSALADSCPPDLPIAADRPGNHPDGGNVLFFDGSVRFLSKDDYENALKRLERPDTDGR